MKTYAHTIPGEQPTLAYSPYQATLRRAPAKPLIQIPQTLSELTGPLYGHNPIGETDNDLTRHHAGEPIGERIIVAGRVLDEGGRPIPNTLVELWQCNHRAGEFQPGEQDREVSAGFCQHCRLHRRDTTEPRGSSTPITTMKAGGRLPGQARTN